MIVDETKPLVTVSVITYNQVSYIRRCIESILMQKTSFPFDLVIGEDCSTDGTREIVMDYAEKYPDLIRLIISDSNVGITENIKRIKTACRGELRASCEGDDYWIDPLKLQKQYEAIVKFDAALVTHASLVVFYADGKISTEGKVRRAREGSGYLEIEDIINRKAKFHTSSFFMRADLINRIPDWYYQCPIGDFPLEVIMAWFGKVYYIDEIMSLYQKGVPGSFTERKKSPSILENDWGMGLEKAHHIMYENIDRFTDYKYSDLIQEWNKKRLIESYTIHGNLDYFVKGERLKRKLRWMAYAMALFPHRIRKKVFKRIVEQIPKGSIEV
jgi:glycosyltransferase involved in cell wall biosynthesis